MIDAIQGPPRWAGPDVLLRQTSFRALAEPRRFRTADGDVVDGSLRVRFGEVEARGIALTPAGRDRYDAVARQGHRGVGRVAAAGELGFLRAGLAYFTFAATGPTGQRRARRPRRRPVLTADADRVRGLPAPLGRRASSSPTCPATARRTSSAEGSRRDAGWLSDVIGAEVADPYALYAAQQQASIDALPRGLRVAP